MRRRCDCAWTGILPPRKERPLQIALPALTGASDAAAAMAALTESVARGDVTAEAKIGELVIPAEAPFRPLVFEAIGDGGANLAQGVENDRRRDFRANADVGAK
jgi:hypothetical protein